MRFTTCIRTACIPSRSIFFHGDQAMASDVSQQVFLKLITSISQFRGDAGFSTWLYRLVVNACLDAARRSKPDVTVSEEFSKAGSQEEDYARAQMAHSVRAAVSALRRSSASRFCCGISKICRMSRWRRLCDCSMGTVASRLSRGHKILAERLKGFVGAKK